MLAAVVHRPGGADVLQLERRPIPEPLPGEVLVRVKAFGISRSDLLVRRGRVPGVDYPRILGSDAVGLVEEAPGGEFQPGEAVAMAMGGMGRSIDGSYAQFTCVPAAQLLPITVDLPWATLGAAPETLHRAWGALLRSLRIEPGERLLVRGGATPAGLAAVGMAATQGAIVCATVPGTAEEALVRAQGARHVMVDIGGISTHLLEVFPRGMDKVLELVGVSTLEDSLRCARRRGTVCLAGLLGSRDKFRDFDPLLAIPSAVNLTTFNAQLEPFVLTPIDELLADVRAGAVHVRADHIFPLERIADSHRAMEDPRVTGKIVVMPED